jgi:hypothetical protein
VASPPELPCPTCAPTSPANCWRCVGSDHVRWFCRRARGWGQWGGAVSLPCVVGQLSCRGCMTREWAWGTIGTCMGWAWLVHGHGEPSGLALRGVGLAGAWAWGAVRTCPAWSGPGWCRGHWCDLGAPRNIEKTAASGDAACLGLWGQLGRVPGPAAEAVVVLCGVVLCVVCCGTCGRSRWLAVVGWGSV